MVQTCNDITQARMRTGRPAGRQAGRQAGTSANRQGRKQGRAHLARRSISLTSSILPVARMLRAKQASKKSAGVDKGWAGGGRGGAGAACFNPGRSWRRGLHAAPASTRRIPCRPPLPATTSPARLQKQAVHAAFAAGPAHAAACLQHAALHPPCRAPHEAEARHKRLPRPTPCADSTPCWHALLRCPPPRVRSAAHLAGPRRAAWREASRAGPAPEACPSLPRLPAPGVGREGGRGGQGGRSCGCETAVKRGRGITAWQAGSQAGRQAGRCAHFEVCGWALCTHICDTQRRTVTPHALCLRR